MPRVYLIAHILYISSERLILLCFGSSHEVFKALIPVSCVLSKEEEWITSLKNRTLTVSGLISFYAQAPAMRILEKSQIALLEE